MPPIESEHKYIIEMPDIAEICALAGYTRSEIEQIYLPSPVGVTRRIRSRRYGDTVVYTKTEKKRIDALSAIEDEVKISEEEYLRLAENKDPSSRPIRKVRHTAEYCTHTIEIDVYPEWKRCAVLEVEVESASEVVNLPDFIKVIKEVTGRSEYSNASLSRHFPPEPYL